MHFHICPTEIAAFMQLYDLATVYYFHYKHIVMSMFTKWYHKDCEVCNRD